MNHRPFWPVAKTGIGILRPFSVAVSRRPEHSQLITLPVPCTKPDPDPTPNEDEATSSSGSRWTRLEEVDVYAGG